MYVLKECLYGYRLNRDSVTGSRKAYRWDGPELIICHLREKMALDTGDFREQTDRKIVHELFSVVVSQFNGNGNNKKIKKDIEIHLQNPIYRDALERAKFKGSLKARWMHFALKHRCWLLIRLYARLRR